MRCRTDCDYSISGAGDKVGGDKVTLDERRRPLVGESTTLGGTVGLREAAAVVSATVGGCREISRVLPVVDVVEVASVVIKTSAALATSLSSGSASPLGYPRVATPTWRVSRP